MLIGLNGYTKDLSTELKLEINPPVPLNLELPEPVEISHNETIFFGWDIRGYEIITKIYTGYDLWAANYQLTLQKDRVNNIILDICNERLELHKDTYELANNDREYAYELWQQERTDLRKRERTNKMKVLLVSLGTGTVGIAVGILIGFLALR